MDGTVHITRFRFTPRLLAASLCWLSLLMVASPGFTEVPRGSLGLTGGYHLPHEELDIVGNQSAHKRLHGGPYVGLSGSYQVVDAIALQLNVGFLPAYAGPENAAVFLVPFHLDVLAAFSDGDVQPYMSLGVGAYAMVGGDLDKDVDLLLTASTGVRVKLDPTFALKAEVRVMGSDGREWPIAPAFLGRIGAEFLFGEPGAPEVARSEPAVLGRRAPRCIPGPDGRPPAGCDEGDGDGIPDEEDACPHTPGILKFKGCPDTDGDGIPDTQDPCPVTPGPKSLKGCPDRDGDGVEDSRDGCPDTPGSLERHGCPTRFPPEVEQLRGVLLGVSFDRLSELAPGSLTILSRVASTLSRYPQTRIEVVVYCQADASGEDTRALSDERAQVIFNTLVQLGAIPTMIKTLSMGATLPPGADGAVDRIELRVSR